jgi:transposase
MVKAKLQLKIKRFLKKLKIPEFLHKFGPKKYKLVDHISNLLLMQVCQTSLRRTEKLADLFGEKCPSYSALCKSRKRIPLSLWQRLLKLTAGLSSGEVGIDGTGFSKSSPSFYFLKRINSNMPTKRYTKLSSLFDLKTKKFLVMRIRTSPRHDMQDVKYLLKRIRDVKVFCGDRGYDSEELHEICYWRGIQTFIPPKKSVKHGWARKKQLKSWDKSKYNQRSNVESGFSAIKRKYGFGVKARKIQGMRVELLSKGICHNLNLRD